MLKYVVASNLCDKLETDRSRRGGGGGRAPWATEIYLLHPFSMSLELKTLVYRSDVIFTRFTLDFVGEAKMGIECQIQNIRAIS